MAKTTVSNLYNLLNKIIISDNYRSLRMNELRRVVSEFLYRQSPDLTIASNIFSHHVEMNLLTRNISYTLEIERGDRKLRGVGFATEAIQDFATTFLGGNLNTNETKSYLDELYDNLLFSDFSYVNMDHLNSKKNEKNTLKLEEQNQKN